jgi:hypothetical protein
MCAPKVPKPPKPPPVPTPQDAELNAEDTRKRLAARRGFNDAIKTSPLGASDFGKNSQTPGLSAGKTTLGIG